jgi:hypothetical protein
LRIAAAISDLDEVMAQSKKKISDAAWYDRTLGELRRAVDEARAKLAEDQKLANNPARTRACWAAFAAHQREAESVMEECRALIEGMLSRKPEAALDNGLCRLADGLLLELERANAFGWSRFTILGRGEMYLDMAQVIRIRFPLANIWDLPVAVHEFGHFVGTRDAPPNYPALLKDEGIALGTPDWRHRHEYFADAFAACACGPAFAAACVALRFNPFADDRPGARNTHPSDVERAVVLFRVLRMLSKTKNPASIGFLDMLEKTWTESIKVSGPPLLAEDATEALIDRGSDLFDLIERELPHAIYAGWNNAMWLSSRMANGTSSGSSQDISIVDVLNAAWHRRMTSPEKSWEGIAASARKIGELVMERSAQKEMRT